MGMAEHDRGETFDSAHTRCRRVARSLWLPLCLPLSIFCLSEARGVLHTPPIARSIFDVSVRRGVMLPADSITEFLAADLFDFGSLALALSIPLAVYRVDGARASSLIGAPPRYRRFAAEPPRFRRR